MNTIPRFSNAVIAGKTPGWQEMVIYLDGVYQPHCLEADVELGYVLCALRDKDGHFLRDDDGVIRFEMSYGRVEVRRKSSSLEQACAHAVQVDRQVVADLNYLLVDVRAGAAPIEVEQLLSLIIKRVANRTTEAHAQIWQALHPEQPGIVPPLLSLTDAPSSAQSSVVRTASTDCRSEEGVTIGLIDALITILRVLVQRDLTPLAVHEALLDLADDADLRQLVPFAQIGAAGVCAQTVEA